MELDVYNVVGILVSDFNDTDHVVSYICICQESTFTLT